MDMNVMINDLNELGLSLSFQSYNGFSYEGEDTAIYGVKTLLIVRKHHNDSEHTIVGHRLGASALEVLEMYYCQLRDWLTAVGVQGWIERTEQEDTIL